MTPPHPIVAKCCEKCGLVIHTFQRTRCPKCGGWLLSLRDADAAAIEAEMNPVVQAVTVGQYLSAVKTINRSSRQNEATN